MMRACSFYTVSQLFAGISGFWTLPTMVILAGVVVLRASPASQVVDRAPERVGLDVKSSRSVAENDLGMRFVQVGEVQFSIWCTRVRDFEEFARETEFDSHAWRTPGFQQGPEHPVVNVSWEDAVAFCEWLTARDHKNGLLNSEECYRLPTDLEWSAAVGLPVEAGKTPEARDMAIPDVFPWGAQWPPPVGAGNYTGEETGADVCLTGYDDQYSWTSPVGTFAENAAGLYDMGGNVWQWCLDSWNKGSGTKVLRGASWHKGALKFGLLSSCRIHARPDTSAEYYGFRVVRAKRVRN